MQLLSVSHRLLLFPGICDLHHLRFFLAVMRAVHLNQLMVGVNDGPDGPMGHRAPAWFCM